MKEAAIGVIDVGKTNLKLYLLGADTSAQILNSWQIENRVLKGPPYPHFDTQRHWQWLLARLAQASEHCQIEKLITTAHGASAVLLAGEELALPILDYEHDGPETCKDYPTPPFSATFSPPLPLGLNVGRQLYWQRRVFPQAFSRVSSIMPYPQYWAWRLSGVPANELTSIGAHTDLWLPLENRFSDFAHQQGCIIVEGSFIKNALFCSVLDRLRPNQQLLISDDFAGTVQGAAILANWPQRELIAVPKLRKVTPMFAGDVDFANEPAAEIDKYARAWRERISAPIS